MHARTIPSHPRSQVCQIVVHLLRAEFAESGSLRALNTLVSEQLIRGGTNDADLYGLATHLTLDLFQVQL